MIIRFLDSLLFVSSNGVNVRELSARDSTKLRKTFPAYREPAYRQHGLGKECFFIFSFSCDAGL
jgi:hypothetical protein